MQFDAEVEDDFAPRRQPAERRIEVNVALRTGLPGQRGGILHAAQLPDDPDRRNDSADPVVRHGIGIGKFFHDSPGCFL
ncbi:hypothetical protein SDC9_147967 [bioreactor metagenome]|uniref:Uncharacterized protein n=1 Tax=bioreactor metagenome TaxID=1076179 RepID=A0A645EHZ2_9ZZZZ